MVTTSEFGSAGKIIPDFVEKERIIAPKDTRTNEVKAESERAKLPRVNGWRVLIVPYSQPTQSKGGIQFVQQTVDVNQRASVIGYVVEVGPLAYKDEAKFGVSSEPWCKPGDYVIFGRYAGSRITLHGDGDEADLPCRILNDDEILGTVLNPADYIEVN